MNGVMIVIMGKVEEKVAHIKGWGEWIVLDTYSHDYHSYRIGGK